MAARRLRPDEEALLREVVIKHMPGDSDRLIGPPPDRWLSALRVRVRDALGEELARAGFDANAEPTSRGKVLEGLIDYLNRMEFGPKAN